VTRLFRTKVMSFHGNKTIPAGVLIMYDDASGTRREFSSAAECDLYLAAVGLRDTRELVTPSDLEGKLFFDEYRLEETV